MGKIRTPTKTGANDGPNVRQNPPAFSREPSVILYEPSDVLDTLQRITCRVAAIILDPWYNKGIGGVREDYDDWLGHVIQRASELANHVYVWGFPEAVWRQLIRLPPRLSLVAWLTWYYKNCPSVIRGWRSAQYACLHLASPGAKLYPEHFLNQAQRQKQKEGKLRYLPGPASVLEVPLNVGFVGRAEQMGHPAQKPEKVFEPLILMATGAGDTVVDPMCGAGTTGAVCMKLGRKAILCDFSEDYVAMTEQRLGIKRTRLSESSSSNCL
jgi:site-specific DNA-methyltransferase (adenine-specific)